MINNLWPAGTLPAWDGLYRADGSARAVQVDPSVPGGLVLLGALDLNALLQAEPEWVTSFDITVERELPDGSGYLCCGEGSHGSDGFFARLDTGKNLVWAAYLENSNPFVEMLVRGPSATVTSISGRSITVNLH